MRHPRVTSCRIQVKEFRLFVRQAWQLEDFGTHVEIWRLLAAVSFAVLESSKTSICLAHSRAMVVGPVHDLASMK